MAQATRLNPTEQIALRDRARAIGTKKAAREFGVAPATYAAAAAGLDIAGGSAALIRSHSKQPQSAA